MKNDEYMIDEPDTSLPEAQDTSVYNDEPAEITPADERLESEENEAPIEIINEENESDVIDGQIELSELPLAESDDLPDDGENASEDSKHTSEQELGDDDQSYDETCEDANEATKEKKDAEEGEKPRRVDSLFDFMELFVFVLAAVFIITSFFFRYSIVDGGSMLNTLEDDEILLLRSFLYTPECGDVVVLQDKSSAIEDPIVKRVIAVGGQKVRFTRDAVYVDGVKLDEPYVYTGDYENHLGEKDVYRYSVYPDSELLPIVTDRENGVFYEITVPEGEIFVMGDHRNNSKDSREIGTLHEDAVIGKVVLRFFPFEKFGNID